MKQIKLVETDLKQPLQCIEVEMPIPNKGEVLILNKAFSINPVDVKTRTGGGIYGPIKNESPIILGWDVAGEIVKIGEEVDSFKIGDKVFGMVNFPGHGKTYAEYVLAPYNDLAKIPENQSYTSAAATTLAALTAYQILSRHIKKGEKVFIQSAAGGVGHFAVQIAKILGAHVIGTASEKNREFLLELGIDEFIDYTKSEFDNVVQGVDFALDTMGGEILKRTFKIMRSGGKIISIPTGVSKEFKQAASELDVFVDFELVKSSGKDMRQLAEWLKSGLLTPHIYRKYQASEIELAHKQILSGSTRGKIVVCW